MARRVNPLANGILNGADDDMRAGHGVADAAGAIGGIASSRLQQVHFRGSYVQNGGFLVVPHVRAESDPGSFVPDDFFAKLAAVGKHHDLMNLAFQRGPPHDLSRIADHAITQHFHLAGFGIDRHFAVDGIHDVEFFRPMPALQAEVGALPFTLTAMLPSMFSDMGGAIAEKGVFLEGSDLRKMVESLISRSSTFVPGGNAGGLNASGLAGARAASRHGSLDVPHFVDEFFANSINVGHFGVRAHPNPVINDAAQILREMPVDIGGNGSQRLVREDFDAGIPGARLGPGKWRGQLRGKNASRTCQTRAKKLPAFDHGSPSLLEEMFAAYGKRLPTIML